MTIEKIKELAQVIADRKLYEYYSPSDFFALRLEKDDMLYITVSRGEAGDTDDDFTEISAYINEPGKLSLYRMMSFASEHDEVEYYQMLSDEYKFTLGISNEGLDIHFKDAGKFYGELPEMLYDMYGSFLEGFIKATEHFIEYGKTKSEYSFVRYFESVGCEDYDRVDYIPIVKKNGDEYTFSSMQVDLYETREYPEMENDIEIAKKKDPGLVYHIDIGTFPHLIAADKNGVPVFTWYVYVSTFKRDEDYRFYLGESEQEALLSLKQLMEQELFRDVKPQAVHTYTPLVEHYLERFLGLNNIKHIKHPERSGELNHLQGHAFHKVYDELMEDSDTGSDEHLF